MKKTFVRIAAVALVLVMLTAVLASCGTTLSGVYSGELGIGSLVGGKLSYNFKGSKVTITVTTTLLGSTSSQEFEGKYEITEADDGTQSITFTFESDDEDAKSYGGTKTFAQDKDAGTITIGGLTYTKQ